MHSALDELHHSVDSETEMTSRSSSLLMISRVASVKINGINKINSRTNSHSSGRRQFDAKYWIGASGGQ